jgi:hypothetical protein
VHRALADRGDAEPGDALAVAEFLDDVLAAPVMIERQAQYRFTRGVLGRTFSVSQRL